MLLTTQEYLTIKQTIIEMLYDRSEQNFKFRFIKNSLNAYDVMPLDYYEDLIENAFAVKVGKRGNKYIKP